MHLIAPDILTDVVALSSGLLAFGYAVGLLMWLCGWRWHRFWVVWAVTVGAGVVGLVSGRALGGHMLVAAMLLAIAGGLLAMELARLVSFAAGGLLVWLGAKAIAPAANDLTICFLLGGLVSLLLYRFWTMLLTSFVGTTLATFCGLGLVAKFLKTDVVALATNQPKMINAAVVGVAFLGLCWQSYLERRSRRGEEQGGKKSHKHARPEDVLFEDEEHEKPKKKGKHKHEKEGGSRWLPFPRKAA